MVDKIKKLISINDLKDLEYSKSDLTPQQRLAIKNFDRFRFKTLSSVENEDEFHRAFHQLQVHANLTNYEEFLKDEYG